MTLFCVSTKLNENAANILNCGFHNKFTLCHIKPNSYIWRTNFASHKQYLFGLLTVKNAKNTPTDQSIPHVLFILSEKKQHTNL